MDNDNIKGDIVALTTTPGPWAWQNFGGAYFLTAQHGMREIIIAGGTKREEESNVACLPVMNSEKGILEPVDPTHPNARLIAAAPDLFQALIKINNIENAAFGLKSFDIERFKKLVSEAIKKATK